MIFVRNAITVNFKNNIYPLSVSQQSHPHLYQLLDHVDVTYFSLQTTRGAHVPSYINTQHLAFASWSKVLLIHNDTK